MPSLKTGSYVCTITATCWWESMHVLPLLSVYIDTESMHTGHTTAHGIVFPVCFRICLVGYQNLTCLRFGKKSYQNMDKNSCHRFGIIIVRY